MTKRFIDETNHRYGKLVVIERVEPDLKGNIKWKCKCDCGKETIVRGQNLRNDNTKSCGCIHNGPNPGCRDRMRKRPYEWLYSCVLYRMKKYKKNSSLTYEQFLDFTKITKCYYCGENITWEQYSSHDYHPSYNLDRMNNSLGYTKENCVVCCYSCNFLKGTKSKDDFLAQVKKIYNHQNKVNCL